MKMLVLGNGFDLMHGLDTGYSNFLDFIEKLNERYKDYYVQIPGLIKHAIANEINNYKD